MVSSNAIIEGYVNGKEGSQITIHCWFGHQSKYINSTCVDGGIWSPDPAKQTLCEGVIINILTIINLLLMISMERL